MKIHINSDTTVILKIHKWYVSQPDVGNYAHFDCRDLNTHINVYLASTCPNPTVFFMDLGLNHFVFISLNFLQRLRILNILA